MSNGQTNTPDALDTCNACDALGVDPTSPAGYCTACETEARNTDTVARMETIYANRQTQLARAEDADARGLTYLAKSYRRSAAGSLSAYNRIAKGL